MLKFEEICELVRLVGSTGIARVEVEHGGARVEIEGRPQPQVVMTSSGPDGAVVAPQQVILPPPVAAEAHGGDQDDVPAGDQHMITSPIVGTFFRAPSPDADPFVRVGDEVRVGQVLCIVEAMKLMNEIESELDGTIVKVHVDNDQPVEYGQTLFTIRPA
jgi:acetyl-CoA carboxylase biotin carboxyl carrier protein